MENNSIWSIGTDRKPLCKLDENLDCDTVIIGGGLAGILTAYYLLKNNHTVIVLEGSQIGSGQTKNTTAKITAQHGLKYADLIKKLGYEKAQQYASANANAIREFEKTIDENNIDCDFIKCPSYVYSKNPKDLSSLQSEANAAAKLGFEAKFTLDTELPFEVVGAVKFDNQAAFHPLKFLYALSSKIKVYENSKVKFVNDNEVITDSGTVRAKNIVFATHYPFVNAPGFYFTKIYRERSYLLALKNAAKLDGVYLETGKSGFTMRNYGDYLIFGGSDHRTGDTCGGNYEALFTAAKNIWKNCTVTAKWSAQDCMTVDNIPYIGNYSALKPNWYVATGFGKWGMTGSMVSAQIISDMILGRENNYKNVFCATRKPPLFSVKKLTKNLSEAAKGLFKKVFERPHKTSAALSLGQGGIIRHRGKKVGAYKDERGNLHLIDIRCPHLGCQLKWNSDEKSWDCPCHGSRFTFRGELIDNPAQEDLKKIDL